MVLVVVGSGFVSNTRLLFRFSVSQFAMTCPTHEGEELCPEAEFWETYAWSISSIIDTP